MGEPVRSDGAEKLAGPVEALAVVSRPGRSDPVVRALRAIRHIGGDCGATTAEIARHIGRSPEAVGQLLRALPQRVVKRDESSWPHRWQVADGCALAPTWEPTGGAGADGHLRAERTSRSIAVAHSALRDGDLKRAARLLREYGISAHEVLPKISLRHRAGVAVALAYLEGDLAMAGGRADRAVRRLDDAIHLAREHAPHLASEILVTRAAALRMQGFRFVQRALAAFDEAKTWLPAASGDTSGLNAWIERSRSTPLAVLGAWSDAKVAVDRAFDVGGLSDPIAEAEALLLRARVMLGLRPPNISAAADDVARAKILAQGGPRWIQGWLPRYEAHVYVAARGPMDRLGVAPILERAWFLNHEYGFQRRLVLARIADISDTVHLVDAFSPAMLRSLTQAVNYAHRQRHGYAVSQCRDCSTARLHQRVRHAFGLAPGESRGFLR